MIALRRRRGLVGSTGGTRIAPSLRAPWAARADTVGR
jgi:hypothetical protein